MNRRSMLIVYLLAVVMVGCGRVPHTAALAATPDIRWKKFVGGGAALWLPETYESLDLAAGIDKRIAKLKLFGPKFAQTAQMIERSRSSFVLWASDTRAGYLSCAATVGVIQSQPVSAALTLDQFVEEALRQLPRLRADAEVRLIDRQTVALDQYQATRMILEFPGACRKELLYTLKSGDRFWLVVYAADIGDFERRLPSFERSIRTFALEEAG